MADNILADVNVCLDLLLDRRPFVEASGKIFEMAEQKQINLFISGLSFDTLFYIMKPALGTDKTTKLLQDFRKLLHVGTVNHHVVDQALHSGWGDLEDALHYFCAAENRCTILLSRNKKDFKPADESVVRILTPEEYLKFFDL